MSSPPVVQDVSETAHLLENNDTNFEENVVKGIDEFLKFEKQNKKENNKTFLKKKRKLEENIPPNILTEVFLRIFYPISSCMSKSVSIGLVKSLEYSPTVILNHGTKMVLFSENAWDSFLKHLHLIECYLTNSLFGRKTNIRLLDCDNEIDIVKHRGQQQVRIRDLTQHENKILLTREEFYILTHATSPITRYMKQLVFSSSVIKEYLVDTCEKQPDSALQYGPVDTSIFNRIPYEVEMWRQLRNFEPFTEIATEATEETNNDNIKNNEEETLQI
jgi:hypothetical protein